MTAIMRTPRDRLRHTLIFEALLLLVLTPLISFFLDKPMATTGSLTIFLSLTAMTWNYVYNYAFDIALIKSGKPLYPRGKVLRIVHAVLFEITLFFVSAPLIMYLLHFTFTQALMFDVAFVILVPIYAFFFNIAYDRIFPVPQSPAK